MAGINFGDVLEVIIHGSLFSQQIKTRFHYQCLDASTEADPVNACTTFAGSWKAGAVSPFLSFLAVCPPEYNADLLTVQLISPTRYRPGQNAVNLPGTNATSTTTTNQAAVITRAGIFAGRPHVGSIHIPGLAGANMLDGNLTAAFRILTGTLASKMLNNFTDLADGTTLVRPVIYHYRKPPLPALNPTPLYTAFTQLTARTMRRRTVGVGK
jgi:hypothetical protein